MAPMFVIDPIHEISLLFNGPPTRGESFDNSLGNAGENLTDTIKSNSK